MENNIEGIKKKSIIKSFLYFYVYVKLFVVVIVWG